MFANRSAATMLGRMMTPSSCRMFSAASIKSRFEAAYTEKQGSASVKKAA
jgi:hypothetical protein